MRNILICIAILLLFGMCKPAGHEALNEKVTADQHGTQPGTDKTDTVVPARRMNELDEKAGLKSKRSVRPVQADPFQDDPLPSAALREILIINRIRQIRATGIDPDPNEPYNRAILAGAMPGVPFPSMITLARENQIRINFDNDIFDYTDRFYTNGIKIDLITPGLHRNPLSKLMLPYWSGGINYHGISLVQNMYTPSTTKLGGILYGDRPYAAYLCLGSFKITNDMQHRFRQTSIIDLGIIGPGSYGEWVQKSFHNSVPTNNEPLGWEYQIQNDVVANYTLQYEKGIAESRGLEVHVISSAQAGTLYTGLSGGVHVRAGLFNPYYQDLGLPSKNGSGAQRMFQCFVFLKGSAKAVGYDATLQGGMFNQESVYTIPSEKVSRLVFQSSAGLTLSYKGFRLNAEQFLLSPDFSNGLWHKWVHLSLWFAL